MLASFSWSEYIETVLILLAIYYPVIIFLYYRGDLIKYFSHGIELPDEVDQKQGNDKPGI